MRPSPLALGTLAGLASAAALSPFAAGAMRSLTAARTDRATLARVAAAPPQSRAIVAGGYALRAASEGAAADALAARLRTLAGRGGLLVEEATAVASPGLARARLRVSGSEDAVIAFADGLERGRPIVRFASWSVEARGKTVTLSGEVVSPWQ